ncbi:MmpL domain-containing protein [Syntrophobotulus glycolicus DSM 8271]|uniref:MmpL domain-containing protein n=1 Tax=Syntrophobotulus glycolicus (strain DSM 8271 / FlGlyR) TaxID=645991 RepID=F0SUM7_SYNGF|nr:MMPL family transporter [Syntrophobotulus glycolicus]ADY55520.1 MmpL domain-containing protein [Syntrophobotulus glycolicus DSM 8271]
MTKIIKARWIIFTLWLAATIALTAFQPDINAILRQQGQQALSANSPTAAAQALFSKMEMSQGTDSLLVFYDENSISAEEMERIRAGVQAIRDSGSELGISKIIDPFSTPEAADSLISGDGTTVMVSFKLDQKAGEIDDIENAIAGKLGNVRAEHYLTGEDFIQNDYLEAALAGVEKSAVLTVLFIFIILIILFRSVVTPLVSLAAVAFSYLCSMGIAAQLIANTGFPVTSLTQVLLVLILFGIGTDYNILLFNRFREELAHGCPTDEAILNTYKSAGKTIAYSILTVFIAFCSLIFSESPIYQSGIVVVIGVAVLLLEIMTLTPLSMKVLGHRLFWPSQKTGGHRESTLWGKISSASTRRPVIAVLLIALLVAPTVYFHEQKLNFDNIAELGPAYPSTKGFAIVADHFGRGRAMPVSVIIDNHAALDQNEALAVIDTLTERLKQIEGVDQVSSVTQPQGSPIPDFYIGSQVGSVNSGLSRTQDGTEQIADGLKLAQDKLGSADFSQAGQIADGTVRLQDGMTALTDGLKQVQAGLAGGSPDSPTLSNGMAVLETNLAAMSGGVAALAANYETIQAGYAQMGASYQQAAQALLGAKSALTQLQAVITALGGSYAGAQSDPNYLQLQQSVDSLTQSLSGITPQGIEALNENYAALSSGFAAANQSLAAMRSGLEQISSGLQELQSALDTAASGLGTIAENMDSVTAGLSQLESGQQQLAAGLDGFSSFGTRLKSVNSGLEQLSAGLGLTNGFLSQLNTSQTFHLPAEALTDEGFQQSLEMFLSADRTMTKMIIVLDADPYSEQALDTVRQINETLTSGLDGTVLAGAQFGVAGPSAMTADMNDVLNRDLNRMIVIVLTGVFLVLLLVIRSLWPSVFITASLLGAYYAAMFAQNYIFLNLLGLEGISSYVPFFSFIVIVALGVDYSIFLMMRFKEYPQLSAKEAIVLASRHTGGVVTSAALILGGTFATLLPSGLTLLVQLAAAVIAGLIVLCFILLPVFLPAVLALPDAAARLFPKKKQGLTVKEDSAV